MRHFVRRALAAIALASALPLAAVAQGKLTTPKQFFGHEIGEDYWLPNYAQFSKYWETLARESDRMVLDTIGLTAEGRPQLVAVVSTPDNIRNREKYRQIAERLSHADGLTEAQARALAKEGKAIIWIDGGLHATEVLGANQLLETMWQFVSMSDEETTRILNDVIIVFVHANPDGMELVANWYMRESDPKKRNMQIPRLYQKYIGHDNNRDFYAVNQPESYNMNRALYQQWYPQIMYNHHQTGPAGTVMFAPPFRDPMNYNLHSQIMTGPRPGWVGDARALRRREQAGRDDARRPRCTRRGGTAACAPAPTSITSSACSPRPSAIPRRCASRSCPTS